ncbi:MAG: hypothetical protein Q9180_007667 [Flavoplaca navasiana]
MLIRSSHTTLNQLILQFLPLSLPPQTSSNHLYALGISHFLPIYSAFESSFRTHKRSKSTPLRTRETLSALHLPGLERAEALEKDINLLLPPLRRVPSPRHHSHLEAFKRHIQVSLSSKPHLLFAYTWIFYMALFSGGRYIRSKLRAAFSIQVACESQHSHDELSGLSFWSFPSDTDGEDLKNDFKARVATLSEVLTEQEKADIITESVHIMVSLTEVVSEIADTVPERAIVLAQDVNSDTSAGRQGPMSRIRPSWIILLRYVLPMGLLDLLSAATGTAASRTLRLSALPPISVQAVAE